MNVIKDNENEGRFMVVSESGDVLRHNLTEHLANKEAEKLSNPEPKLSTVEMIKQLKASGEFHHATARQQGSRTDIYIYKKADNFRGFDRACSTSSWSDDYDEVNSMLSGIHVGSYNQG